MGRLSPIDWNSLPLGVQTDAEIARGLGVHRSTVTRARQAREIPGHHKRHVEWDDVPLGLQPDEQLARELGVPIHWARAARVERGIPTWTPSGVDWDEVDFGKTNRALAEQLGVSSKLVSTRRRAAGLAPETTRNFPKGIDWDNQPLGNVPDGELARSLGVTRAAVTTQRENRAIARMQARIDWASQPLGKVPDEVLATRLGVTANWVSAMRRRHGIAAKRKRRRGA